MSINNNGVDQNIKEMGSKKLKSTSSFQDCYMLSSNILEEDDYVGELFGTNVTSVPPTLLTCSTTFPAPIAAATTTTTVAITTEAAAAEERGRQPPALLSSAAELTTTCPALNNGTVNLASTYSLNCLALSTITEPDPLLSVVNGGEFTSPSSSSSRSELASIFSSPASGMNNSRRTATTVTAPRWAVTQSYESNGIGIASQNNLLFMSDDSSPIPTSWLETTPEISDSSNSSDRLDLVVNPMGVVVGSNIGSTSKQIQKRKREPDHDCETANPPSAKKVKKDSSKKTFITKLYDLVEDPMTDTWIHWFNEGKEFRFSSLKALLNAMRERGATKAKSTQSINKNLNDYSLERTSDFRKKDCAATSPFATWECFRHPCFREGQRELLDQIMRKPHPTRGKKKLEKKRETEAGTEEEPDDDDGEQG
ncbi:hypothetical protein H4219_005579 [Mycoemilia scoparia]|uniref:HSF-type DNA-binding domain-containing protein n=1 Tax=Mycoemilia scoparia TaxID=417184 RepID=A0A9W7ZVJ2_9FUNG|nr:hypothetical protein H4219_005579 [Mycoemilia scoparia]